MAAHIIIDYDLTERLDDSEIQQQLKKVSANSTLVSVLEAMPHSVMILNHCRQIVWANASLFSVLTNKGIEQLAEIGRAHV
jgi:c-di-AMP phosphodiesterase-like protein